MTIQVVMRSKGIRQRVETDWQELKPKEKVRLGAYRNKHMQKCLVGLNYEGRFVTSVFVENVGSYAFMRALALTYSIPVEYLFEQKPFPL